jgi:glycine oxidase
MESSGLEVLVAGAGVIGLSIALELRLRGHSVAVVDTQKAMRQASWAAAGMLAVDDPHNPVALLPLSQFSVALYPEYLRRVEALSGEGVPFQTAVVVEHLPGEQVVRRAEWSLDPRQLATALLSAVRRSGMEVHDDAGEVDVSTSQEGVAVRLSGGRRIAANYVVHASGAWFQGRSMVRPRKGQMLRVQMPAASWITEVHRRADVYIVPRTQGPQAGTAVIGATVEDVGFDVNTRQVDLEGLRLLASELVPVFGDAAETPTVEAWAGLRPGSPDDLPVIGAMDEGQREFVATGHFRNGILLAPGTAVVVADMIEGKPERIDLEAYGPDRFRRE